MKVTLLTLEYPPYVYGGVGRHVENLSKHLAKYLELEIRTLNVPGSDSFEAKGKLVIRRYKDWSSLTEEQGRFAPVFRGLSLSLAVNKDPIDSDIVHFHTWYMALGGVYAKKLYGVKLVTTVHSLEPRRPWKRDSLGMGYNLSTWAERIGLSECDMVIAVSNYMKNDIVELYNIPANKIKVIHNGIDEKIWKPTEDRSVLRKYGIRMPYALFVGRISRQKGILDLLKAAKLLPKYVNVVLVTGKPDDPRLLSEVKRRIADLGNIIWINKMMSEEELVPLYTLASVFVCPSIYEPFGIVNLEAMSTETPVVATKVGGITEVVSHGRTGLLVEPGNPKELADAISYLISNPEEAKEIGRKGREEVLRRFTWSRVAKLTYEAYKDLIGE
ncbi:MAG: glycogen synthase [Thermoprotei archaeon]|nr:MAG: glycogen synthase [Thermoprotei archaeon]